MPPCAFTCSRAHGGNGRRKAGECALTKIAYKADGFEDLEKPAYVICTGCHQSSCVDCWEQIAELYDKVAARWEVVAHDVWLIVSLRAWRASSFNLSLRGFEPRKGGGGRFLAECPLCFEQSFEAPSPPVPRTLKGLQYEMHPPKVYRRERIVVHAPTWGDDASAGPVRAHSVDLEIVDQIVPNDEADRCFRSA